MKKFCVCDTLSFCEHLSGLKLSQVDVKNKQSAKRLPVPKIYCECWSLGVVYENNVKVKLNKILQPIPWGTTPVVWVKVLIYLKIRSRSFTFSFKTLIVEISEKNFFPWKNQSTAHTNTFLIRNQCIKSFHLSCQGSLHILFRCPETPDPDFLN